MASHLGKYFSTSVFNRERYHSFTNFSRCFAVLSSLYSYAGVSRQSASPARNARGTESGRIACAGRIRSDIEKNHHQHCRKNPTQHLGRSHQQAQHKEQDHLHETGEAIKEIHQGLFVRNIAVAQDDAGEINA